MSHWSNSLCRQALLSSVAFTAYALTMPAAAQEQAEGENPDVIVITGAILQSQEASLDAKREALKLTDVAAADSVGRFPDQNSAAALSRLPAIAVQRDQGQERYIQVRSAPNRWTSVSIDGIPLTGVDEGGDSRAFRFDAVPAVALSQMVVNKSLTADQQADAIFATIDLQTYSPMERDGLHVSGDLGYGYMDQGGGEQRQASARASWSNDMFGVVLGGSHYRREQLTDNREVGLYDALGPTEFDIRQYEIERWSNSLFGGVEYVPSDNLRLFLKGIFAEFNDDEQRNQYELRLDRAASGTRGFAAGNLVGVPLRGSFNYGEYRNQNTLGTFGADYETPNGFSSSLRLNYTKTENTTYLPLVQASTSGTNSPSISYDASDPRFPLVTLFQTVGPAPLTRGAPLSTAPQGLLNAAGAILIDARQATEVDAYTARLDLTQEFDNGLTLKGGAYYVDRQINGNNFSFSNVAAVGAAGFNVNSYLTNEPWDTQFPLGFTLNYLNNVAMRADIDVLLAQLTAAGRFNPANSIPATDLYDQNETILAGYVSAELALDNLTIIGGLRVENYEMENAGTVRSGTVFTPLTVDQSETDLFPSLNLRYEASDDLILRVAAQRGISRPAYGAIRVGAAINDTSTPGTIGGGNPNLLPEMTWGVDASAEYYLPTNGIVSVTGFYRWVDNVFYQGAQLVTDDTYDTGTIDRTGYLLSGTLNGENGRLYGVEFNVQNQFDFLPSPFDGFGVQGNLTLLEGEYDAPATATLAAQTGLPFQGLSDTIANASLYYEKYGFSARLSYQWRSDWEDTLGGLGAGETRKGYENLDVSLRYAINENLTVFADLANLTDEYYVAYTGRPDLPSEVEQIGERYLFGIRVNY